MSTESAEGDLIGTAKEPKDRVAMAAESHPISSLLLMEGFALSSVHPQSSRFWLLPALPILFRCYNEDIGIQMNSITVYLSYHKTHFLNGESSLLPSPPLFRSTKLTSSRKYKADNRLSSFSKRVLHNLMIREQCSELCG